MLKSLISRKRGGFTLVEIMIVVAIIALLAAIAVPNFLRSRKRSQATSILQDLRQLDAAIDQYAIENHKQEGDPVAWADIQKYLKKDSRLYSSNNTDVLGNPFHADMVDEVPKVSAASFAKLSDVAPADFWSPYNP